MPESIQKLITLISFLPWIWEKSATKLAFFFLNSNQNFLDNLSNELKNIKNEITKCEKCWLLIDKNKNICNICSSKTRNQNIICVVEEYLDYLSIEKTWVYDWVYHILWWAISPMNWVFIWDLNFDKLFSRLSWNEEKEIIIATNPNIEWEATSSYINEQIEKRWLKRFIKITRLSRWLSSWYLEYADNITLINSIKDRKQI